MITVSRRLEAARMDLACHVDFNIMEAFSIFDTDGKGFCTIDEFHNKFKNIAPEKNPTFTEVELLFKRHNRSGDGQLKYSEFMHAISPLTNDYSDMLNQRKPKKVLNKSKLPFQIFEGETYNTMIFAIQMLLDTEAHMERVRLKLSERRGFSIPHLFQTLLYQSVRTDEDHARF